MEQGRNDLMGRAKDWIGVGSMLAMRLASSALVYEIAVVDASSANEITLVDALSGKVRGEMLDLQHAAATLGQSREGY
jgi:malate/lactate dehydrogenase